MEDRVITGTRRLGMLAAAPVVAVMAASFGATFAALPARAALTFDVNSFDDRRDTDLDDNICRTSAGTCTLRAALQQANESAGLDTVRVPGGTYRLGFAGGVQQSAATVDPADNSRDLDIKQSVTIRGLATPTGTGVTINGGRFSSIFEVDNASAVVSMQNLTLTNGGESEISGFGSGAGLMNRAGSVTLSRVIVRDNVTTLYGSGIANAGTMTLNDSTVDNNRNLSSLGGGGVTATGGGIMNFSTGTLTVNRSTISNNFALRGGGLNNSSGRVTIVNSTITGNTVRNGGGGIRNAGSAAALTIAYSTIVGNAANIGGGEDVDQLGGGIDNVGGQIAMGSTILAGNTNNRSRIETTFTPDCHSTEALRFTSHRKNVIGMVTPQCVIRDTAGGELRFDKFSQNTAAPLDPKVGAPAFTGGSTQTRLPLGGSPAIDFAGLGSPSAQFNCPAVDQRGVSRPRDGDGNGTALCDTGSAEIG